MHIAKGIAATVLFATVAGCSPNTGTTTAELMATNPSAVCASSDTMDALKNVIFSHVSVSGSDPKQNLTYKDELAAGAKFTVDTVVLDSFDKTTKKVACSGRLTLTWPDFVIARQKAVDPTANWGPVTIQGEYSVQPEATGDGFVYSLDGETSQGMIGVINDALQAMAKVDTAAGAPAAQVNSAATPPIAEAPVVSPGGSVFPVGPAFANYPAEPYRGPLTYPDFTGNAKSFASYRSRIREAVRNGPVFAGDMAVAEFGCGTGCSTGYLINVQTGDVYGLPVGGEEQPLLQLNYQQTSRLLEAEWADSDMTPATCSRQFFEWTGSAFRTFPKQDEAGECPQIEH